MVTGGGGSIGSELCRQIANFLPKRLVILDNYENNAYDIQNELLYKHPDLKLDTVIANIRENREWKHIKNTGQTLYFMLRPINMSLLWRTILRRR